MPRYRFRCKECRRETSIRCPIDARDAERVCSFCGGALIRRPTAGLGLLARSQEPVSPDASSGAQQGRSTNSWAAIDVGTKRNIRIENVTIGNFGVGVRMDGGNGIFQDMPFVDTPVAFDFTNDPSVQMGNISQTFSDPPRDPNSTRSKRPKRKKRKQTDL